MPNKYIFFFTHCEWDLSDLNLKPSVTGRMKSFKLLVLKDITAPLLDPLQFAYWGNRSVEDSVNMGHLHSPETYARIMLVDFSLAINTILPEVLCSKLTQLTVPACIRWWITNFLTDRRQQARQRKVTSSNRTIKSAGASQSDNRRGNINIGFNTFSGGRIIK